MNTIKPWVFIVILGSLVGCQASAPLMTPPSQVQKCPVVEAPVCEVCVVTTCPEVEPPPIEKPAANCPAAAPAKCPESKPQQSAPLIGGIEWVGIEPGGMVLEARIDTGAQTSSIHAEDIRLIEKDGRRWVKFSLIDPVSNQKRSVERPLKRRIAVKQTDQKEKESRYVVRMWVSLGDVRLLVDISLSDRDNFDFPVLIGRNMLMDNFVVDVSKQRELPKPAITFEEE